MTNTHVHLVKDEWLTSVGKHHAVIDSLDVGRPHVLAGVNTETCTYVCQSDTVLNVQAGTAINIHADIYNENRSNSWYCVQHVGGVSEKALVFSILSAVAD